MSLHIGHVERLHTHQLVLSGDVQVTIEWRPTPGNVVTSVALAGLRISHLLEMEDSQEKFNLPGYPAEFHLRATKE